MEEKKIENAIRKTFKGRVVKGRVLSLPHIPHDITFVINLKILG